MTLSDFSALAAASCGLVSFDGVGLAFRVDGLARGRQRLHVELLEVAVGSDCIDSRQLGLSVSLLLLIP